MPIPCVRSSRAGETLARLQQWLDGQAAAGASHVPITAVRDLISEPGGPSIADTIRAAS